MATLATLTTTTLSQRCDASDAVVYLTSTSGVLVGMGVWVDAELMRVVSVGTRADGGVVVARGVEGSIASRHQALAPVTIGRLDQFYTSNPAGLPSNEALVTPWINTMTGQVWSLQGDESSPQRWWQDVTTTYGIGSLGVRTTTVTPSS